MRVAVIEPAATKTSFESSTVQADKPLAIYNPSRAKYLIAFENSMAAADPAAARDKTPLLRYPSGNTARQVAFARRFFPRPLFDKILRKQFGLA
ncbi:hypothetical protein FTW19_08155 [Terriglobus albidus]|uniref:Uncharacterized protein n=1 Tax=Terriglobus albidus TaxID=1592106 RepID=A0A5B9EBA8_9BACT|nr:hypothetical protein [Terriglobus albidus]QEE27970.1 hypothetical protein FTW19_08155 [Terriglobus albidus]